VERAKAALDDDWLGTLSEEERAAIGKVDVDLDEEDAACPACGAAFDPDEGRCPDCGLNFGTGED